MPPHGADPQYVVFYALDCLALVRSVCRLTTFVRALLRLWSWFTSVDKDRSGAISAVELRKSTMSSQTHVIV